MTDEERRLTDRLHACLGEIAQLHAQQEWQPFDTVPTDGTHVWIWNGYRRCVGYYRRYRDGSEGWHRHNIISEPLGVRDMDNETHWQPLPAPPVLGAPRAPQQAEKEE